MAFSYPVANLSIYAPDHIGVCMVSFYDQNKTIYDSSVYIVDVDQCFGMDMYDEKLARLDSFPPAGEVFLVDLGPEGYHRAVINCQVDKMIRFIDCGEVIQVSSTSDLKLFSLSERAQKLSARAINCTIVEVLDEFDKPINDLAKILDQIISFTVHDVHEDKIVVTLRKMKSPKKVNAGIELSQEERKILFEEPQMVTTNALKAVAGYVPKDEKQICKFYNSTTGHCFKGNSCHLIHVPTLSDGTTRDRKETTNKLVDQLMPMIGMTYKVGITSVASVEDFYVYIPEIAAHTLTGSLEDFKKQINAADMVEKYQPYKFPGPDTLDYVLVKHMGVFYRGRVTDKVTDCEEEYFSVFFIDYGGTELVSIDNIFQWHTRWNLPALAYHCIMENIQLNQDGVEARNALCNLIRCESGFSIKVISCTNDLHVRLIDDNGYDVGDTLCASLSGLCAKVTKLVPMSISRIPG